MRHIIKTWLGVLITAATICFVAGCGEPIGEPNSTELNNANAEVEGSGEDVDVQVSDEQVQVDIGEMEVDVDISGRRARRRHQDAQFVQLS